MRPVRAGYRSPEINPCTFETLRLIHRLSLRATDQNRVMPVIRGTDSVYR